MVDSFIMISVSRKELNRIWSTTNAIFLSQGLQKSALTIVAIDMFCGREKKTNHIGNSSFNIKSDQLWKHFGGFAFSKMLASFCCCCSEIGFKFF